MDNDYNSLMYSPSDDSILIRNDYSGAVEKIEEFIRYKRVSKLIVDLDRNFPILPCVTFIIKLDVRDVGIWNMSSVGEIIRAMVVLKSVSLSFIDKSPHNHSITNAIATHPSLKKVVIYGHFNDNIGVIAKANPRIISYVLGACVDLDYEYGDILASATGIIQLWTVGKRSVFRDGGFIRFARNNRSVKKLRINVSRTSEVTEALGYLDAIEILRIGCEIRDDNGSLERAIIGVLARCRPTTLVIHDDKTYFCCNVAGQSEQPWVWPNCYAICHRKLPKWNYKWSAPICDVDVHASNR